MPLQETATFEVNLTFTTENGELPDDQEVERLIADQMHGELDEATGLGCMAVDLIRRLEVEALDRQALERVISDLLPGCSFGTDNEGQIVVYTNFYEKGD